MSWNISNNFPDKQDGGSMQVMLSSGEDFSAIEKELWEKPSATCSAGHLYWVVALAVFLWVGPSPPCFLQSAWKHMPMANPT